MKILEIDIHAEKTSENLLELARTASSQAHEFIIQDRSPSFFKIWRLLQFDPYKYFGIEDHGQICAVSGMVKTDFAQMPFASEVYMDTDLFANINKKS